MYEHKFNVKTDVYWLTLRKPQDSSLYWLISHVYRVINLIPLQAIIFNILSWDDAGNEQNESNTERERIL